jgi:hypothetical protein
LIKLPTPEFSLEKGAWAANAAVAAFFIMGFSLLS